MILLNQLGQRVVSISYKNADGTYAEIEDGQTYTIATNAFTAKGGDGFTVFAKAYEEGRVTDLGLSDWENLAEHLKSLGTVDPKVEGRIVDIFGNRQNQSLWLQKISAVHLKHQKHITAVLLLMLQISLNWKMQLLKEI